MRPRLVYSVCLLALSLTAPGVFEADNPNYRQRWVYAARNLLDDKSVDDLVNLVQRAQKCGFNGLVIADYKFTILDRLPPRYFENVARLRRAATEAKVEIIPMLFPIGDSNGILAHDHNLAEGLPVKAAPFQVKGGEAALLQSTATRIVNGTLEEVGGDRFLNFTLQDDPGRTTVPDRDVVHGGKVSCRIRNPRKHNRDGMARLAQRIPVRPYTCYRFSCWVKADNLIPVSSFKLAVQGTAKGNRALAYFKNALRTTQDWTQVDVVFNSLGEDTIQVYAGVWGTRSGTVWLDDLAIEEVGLVNVLRRPGCPLLVTSEDRRTVYKEGQDFAPVRDLLLGGRESWAATYDFHHAGPALKLLPGSRIKDGDRLRVSWYHPVIIRGRAVTCCLSEPKLFDVLRDQARRINALFHPTTFFMGHAEIRVAGWCQVCQEAGKTPGAVLAANVTRCVKILKEVNPQARIVVWSDMFDPNHNATPQYYLANGTLAGSWKGLPPEVIIATWKDLSWTARQGETSLRFFADRGHTQIIAGYYDQGMANLHKWETAAKGVPRVTGFMYTTWHNQYNDLEAYGERLRGLK